MPVRSSIASVFHGPPISLSFTSLSCIITICVFVQLAPRPFNYVYLFILCIYILTRNIMILCQGGDTGCLVSRYCFWGVPTGRLFWSYGK